MAEGKINAADQIDSRSILLKVDESKEEKKKIHTVVGSSVTRKFSRETFTRYCFFFFSNSQSHSPRITFRLRFEPFRVSPKETK